MNKQLRTSDLFCEDFGAGTPVYSAHARKISLCGIPAAFGSADIRGGAQGSYTTLFCGDITEETAPSLAEAVSEAIHIISAPHLPSPPSSVLVAAFGNGGVVCDSLGQRTADRLLITGNSPSPSMPSTYAVRTGVPASTGISSLDIVKVFADRLHPELIICLDSVASATPERLCRVVQITDCGIAPGSGVSSHAARISTEDTGIPTVSVGFPTVIRCSSPEDDASMLLTDAVAEAVISRAASAIAGGINLYFTNHCSAV